MIATIAGTPTAGIIAIIASLQCNTDSKTAARKSKGGAWRLPLSFLDYVVSEAR
jgi:hypothetical protein